MVASSNRNQTMINQPSAESRADREIVSARVFDAPREKVFEAFRDPLQLVQWWGPKDFTNTIHEFDLRPGGKWRITLHAPNGANYPNDKVFVEVVPPERVVFDHLEPMHHFRMMLLLADQRGKTHVTWHMLFESAAEVAKLKNFILEANEQNFDRLAAHLSKVPGRK